MLLFVICSMLWSCIGVIIPQKVNQPPLVFDEYRAGIDAGLTHFPHNIPGSPLGGNEHHVHPTPLELIPEKYGLALCRGTLSTSESTSRRRGEDSGLKRTELTTYRH